jgi:hypothetical protein
MRDLLVPESTRIGNYWPTAASCCQQCICTWCWSSFHVLNCSVPRLDTLIYGDQWYSSALLLAGARKIFKKDSLHIRNKVCKIRVDWYRWVV